MTTTTRLRSRRLRALATGLAGLTIGVVLIAIEMSRGAPVERAIGGFAILLVFMAALLIFQTRSETISAVAGDPVDERWRIIHEKALGGAANITAVAALAGFGICEIMGRENWQFALMAIVVSLSYIVGLVWHRGRM